MKHIKYVSIEIFLMCLVLICWLVLYFCYYIKMVIVIWHSGITGDIASTVTMALIEGKKNFNDLKHKG